MVEPGGTLPIVLLIDPERKIKNQRSLTSFLQQKAPFNESRIYKSSEYYIYEYDIQNYFKPSLIGELKKKYKNIVCL